MKRNETACPHCGAPLNDARRRRTAMALVLGLSAATLPATGVSCSDDEPTEDDGLSSTSTEAVTAYGAGPFGGFGGFGGSTGGAGGEGGAGGSDGGSSAGGAGGK